MTPISTKIPPGYTIGNNPNISPPNPNNSNSSNNNSTSQLQLPQQQQHNNNMPQIHNYDKRWNEIRIYSDLIKRFAIEASHISISKENYDDLYNMAFCLLKSVDSLDPDKPKRNSIDILYPKSHDTSPADYSINAQHQPNDIVLDLVLSSSSSSTHQHQQQQQRIQKPNGTTPTSSSNSVGGNANGGGVGYPIYDYYIPYLVQQQQQQSQSQSQSANHSPPQSLAPPITTIIPGGHQSSPQSLALTQQQHLSMLANGSPSSIQMHHLSPPLQHPPQHPPHPQPSQSNNNLPTHKSNNNQTNTSNTDNKPKNFSGEVFFDDIGQDTKPQRRRRRTIYSARRNLKCHLCEVTETPEWRRGPDGDHTLCNACGLHYAKSQKKLQKEKEKEKERERERERELEKEKEKDTRKHSIDFMLTEGGDIESQNPTPD
eukprot:gene8030-9876_t